MYIDIEVSQTEQARNVIKHTMSLYKLSSHNQSRPLEFPDDAERYQLFFIDEDESEHAPEYDMGPRNPDEPIGFRVFVGQKLLELLEKLLELLELLEISYWNYLNYWKKSWSLNGSLCP